MSYEQMSGPELVAEFNRMAQALGREPVKRFATLDAARRRTTALAFEFNAQSTPVKLQQTTDTFNAQMAKAQPVKTRDLPDGTFVVEDRPPAPATGLESLSLRQITDQYNALVATSGKGKHHKSLFESKALGIRQLRRLMEEAGQ